MTVIIPYAEKLAENFPIDRVRSRRDFPKLLGLIEASAFLHQFHREKRDDLIIASEEDYRNVKSLFEKCYATGPDEVLSELLQAAFEVQQKCGALRVSDLIVETGWKKSRLYAVLDRAVELGCIAETETRGLYRFIRNSTIPPLQLPEII